MAITLTIKGLDQIIKKIDNDRKKLSQKMEELVQTLLNSGIPVIDANYNTMGDSSPVHSSYVMVENMGNSIRGTLTVEGIDIAFVEFGAGIYYNGADHPKASEFGFGIGTYGKGQGLNDGWYYYDDSGVKMFSRGTQMGMPVYRAGQEMIKKFDSIVKEVFS